MTQDYQCDVAIIGGGPAGTTAASLLRKYAPQLSVMIIEKEQFPRDHVGESQLPPIGAILDEMGCWEKVESAGFPIKIGVTYRWGKTNDLWDFNFVPPEEFVDAPRPAPYEGLRKRTALQVDRSKYDHILLEHARSLGVEILESTSVKEIPHSGGTIDRLVLSTGSSVEARWYIDASGQAGVMRRAMEVPIQCPSNLKNIAIWDYWENAKWADEIGVGGTRVQVLSQSNGWMWFIPLGPTRTSIGLITSVDYYKESKRSPEELYRQAIERDERISDLTEGATQRGNLETINDWSFFAEKTAGENWFLVGESAGFADPILAAGMTLAQGSARECAYSIIEMERGEFDPVWLRESFDHNQRDRLRQHIRFADFWYAANGQFSDLKDYCQTIAEDAGLQLTSEEAWRWISQGGFATDVPGQAVVAGFFDLASAKRCAEMFTDGKVAWGCDQQNIFKLNLEGVTEEKTPVYQEGRIRQTRCLVRDGKKLSLTGVNELVFAALEQSPFVDIFLKSVMQAAASQVPDPQARKVVLSYALQSLEAMVASGWVEASCDPTRSKLSIGHAQDSKLIKPHTPGPQG